MKFDQDLCLNLWYELNPRVRCAFGNVCILYLEAIINPLSLKELGIIFFIQNIGMVVMWLANGGGDFYNQV